MASIQGSTLSTGASFTPPLEAKAVFNFALSAAVAEAEWYHLCSNMVWHSGFSPLVPLIPPRGMVQLDLPKQLSV